jgi:hypothetical protein
VQAFLQLLLRHFAAFLSRPVNGKLLMVQQLFMYGTFLVLYLRTDAVSLVQTLETSYRILLKVRWHATRCGVISKPLSGSYDITGGLVHLDVCWIDQSTCLPSGLSQTLLIYPSHISLHTPTCHVIRGRFPKLLVAANHNTTGGMSWDL